MQAQTYPVNEKSTGLPLVAKRSAFGTRGTETHWPIVAFFAALAILFFRQPDAILHAQFLAEDGHVWFADAFNRGWFVSLFRTQDGYYQTLPRLAAGLALLGPLPMAPLVMNLVGLLIQVVPAPLLVSRRFCEWGSLGFRAGLALAYLALPNCAELHATVTEAQWHLALIACLLVLARAAPTRLWRWFDIAIFLLFGLTGPFCLFLFPIACAMLYLTAESLRWRPVFIFAGASVLQVGALLFIDTARFARSRPLGASLQHLSQILAGHIYLGMLVGHNTLALQLEVGTLAGIAAVGTALFIWWLVRSGIEMRLFAIFSLILLAASLALPSAPPPPGLTAWRLMAGAPAVRYWFFPTLACTWMLVSFLFGPKRTEFTELVGFTLLLLTLFGFVRDWRHPSYKDLQFARYAQHLATSYAGETIVIPLNPPGWDMRLVKQ